jgi:amidohydrolase
MDTLALAEAEHQYMVGIRRHLHHHPELSFQERETARLVCDELDKLAIPHVTVGEHNVIATIEGRRTDRMLALRADMDALPVQEANGDIDYASQNPGVMHACGHDGHVAMLLGAARVLAALRGQLEGTVKLCFQQAEEVGGGAAEILAELERFPIRSVFGIHLWSQIKAGLVSVEAGPRMAAGAGFDITVKGVGCHGANPDKGVDPIVAASAIVLNASVLISREVNPVHPTVLTFGQFHGGEAPNVIPSQVKLAGSIRNTNNATRAFLRDAFPSMVRATAEAYRCEVEIRLEEGAEICINDTACSDIAAAAVTALTGAAGLTRYDTIMASENFGFYLRKYPGVLAFLGTGDERLDTCWPHHHPRFNIDESQLPLGAALHAEYALRFFAGSPESEQGPS